MRRDRGAVQILYRIGPPAVISGAKIAAFTASCFACGAIAAAAVQFLDWSDCAGPSYRALDISLTRDVNEWRDHHDAATQHAPSMRQRTAAPSRSPASSAPIFAERADDGHRRGPVRRREFRRAEGSRAWSRPACPRELGGGGAEHRRARRDAAHPRPSLRLDRARLLHAHPSGRDSRPGAGRIRRRRAVEPLLKRIAAERIILLSSGGSDWIAGSGKAEKVEGGYRITARKVFSSGAPAGDLLMTGAVLESRRRAADGAAFRRADELAAREGARHLAHARHARHRLARRA